MTKTNKIQLKETCILKVPLQSYNDDFLFIVNGEEIKTSRLAAELLSPVICNIHASDPTLDTFTINTTHSGDFFQILDLVNFREKNFDENEIEFVIEVIEKLGNETICVTINEDGLQITTGNVFSLLSIHAKNGKLFSKQISKEIEFIASQFYEILDNQKDKLTNLSIEILIKILNNSNLSLISEDQLLNFINELYLNDRNLSFLYENVIFENVSSASILDFIEIFDINDITNSIWISLCERLKQETKSNSIEKVKNRYKAKSLKNQGQIFERIEGNDFSGILNFLRNKSFDKIENEIKITSSPLFSNDDDHQPSNVVLFENDEKFFESKSLPNSFLCFDFKKYKIIPTHYTIKTAKYWEVNSIHPRNFVIECSNDKEFWEVIDEQKNCEYLNGPSLVHTFKLNDQIQNEYEYLRIRSNGVDWCGYNYLLIDSFEIYGTLIG